jgi:hypothetical protein
MDTIQEFVEAELKELESKDIDTLYECILENLEFMWKDFDLKVDKDYLYNEIERQLKAKG